VREEALAVGAPGGYPAGAPGPGGRQAANPVRTPKVAAVRESCRRFVRPGALARGGHRSVGDSRQPVPRALVF